MNFITIEKNHINVDTISSFNYDGYQLVIYTTGDNTPFVFFDRNGERYQKLCNHVGVESVW